MSDTVLVINRNDAQTQSIIRKLRSEQIEARLAPGNMSQEEIESYAPRGIIISGGVTGNLQEPFDLRWLEGEHPLLAIGDAALSLLRILGGKPSGDPLPTGFHPVAFSDACPITQGYSGNDMLHLHGVYPLDLTEDLQPAALTDGHCIGYYHGNIPLFGLQLHVETNDPDISHVLARFALEVCGCSRRWNSDTVIDNALSLIRGKVGGGVAVCELTGGVDSGVCAILGQMALKDKLRYYFVDTGLLRDGAREETLRFFADEMGMNIEVIETQERIMQALKGLTDTQAKAKAIRALYQQIRTELAKRDCADVVISTTNAEDLLDGHARFGEFGAAPISQLFKDEVRRLAEVLALPESLREKQSFPETGLALRIYGEVTPERLRILRAADAVWLAEIEKMGQQNKLWQYFTMLLPVDKTYFICLRALNRIERAGALPARIPHELPEIVSDRIAGEIPEVTRIFYDYTAADDTSDIEWL